jgi:TIR domain
MGPKRSIFISYAREDWEHASTLARHLAEFTRQHGGTVFFDQERIKPGFRWDEQIDAGLEEAGLVLLLISSHFVNSKFCIDNEARLALQRSRLSKGAVLAMPVLVSACKYESMAPDPQGPALGLVQAAGPYRQGTKRLVPMEQVTDREAAWAAIVEEVYRHFGISPLGLPALDLPDECADPDIAELLAWCDRTEVLGRIDDYLEDAHAPPQAMLCVAGHAANRPRLLMDRLGHELSAAPRSRQAKIGHLDKEYGFENPGRIGKAAREALGLNTDADVDPWLDKMGLDLLLLCHYVDCTGWSEGRLTDLIRHSGQWLQDLHVGPTRRVLFVLVLRFSGAAPSWMDRIFRRNPDHVQPIQGAYAAAAPKLARRALGSEPLLLRDYEAEDLRKWLALEHVRAGLGRTARDLDESTIGRWFDRGSCSHAELLAHLHERHQNTVLTRGTKP